MNVAISAFCDIKIEMTSRGQYPSKSVHAYINVGKRYNDDM